METEKKKKDNKGTVQNLEKKDYRSWDDWNSLLRDTRDSMLLRILLNRDYQLDEVFLEAAKKLNPSPFGVRREKGQKFVWILAFSPIYNKKIDEIKATQQTINLGEIVAKNLHFGIPKGTKGKIYHYYVDLKDEFFLPTSMVEKALKSQKVNVYWIGREQYKGMETGILTVSTGSVHKDGEIKFSVDGIDLTLNSVSAKMQRKHRNQRNDRSQNVFPTDSSTSVQLKVKKKKRKKKVKSLEMTEIRASATVPSPVPKEEIQVKDTSPQIDTQQVNRKEASEDNKQDAKFKEEKRSQRKRMPNPKYGSDSEG